MTMIARLLPQSLAVPLFGDRKRYGPVPVQDDPDWIAWQKEYLNFYNSTQKSGAGARVNDAGYKVLQRVSLEGRSVGEIGPGSLPHRSFWQGTPAHFKAFDINPDFLKISEDAAGCSFEGIQVAPSQTTLPIADASLDFLLSFYSLEHLHPLGEYLDDYARCLAPGGQLVGAIPNEGGLAWGLGRFLTSRRWIHKNTEINYDKIICWEHPNFADTIIAELDKRFTRRHLSMYPALGVFGQNATLVTRFVYEKA